MRTFGRSAAVLAGLMLGVCACSPNGGGRDGGAIRAENHTFFPITSGAHALGTPIQEGEMTCDSCHPPSAASFKDFTCTGCHGHEQTVTDLLHTSVPDYAYANDKCLACHPAGEKVAFDHAGITSGCALCHDVGTQFAALPKPNFTHPATGGADCAGCHKKFDDWTGASMFATGDLSDPARSVTVDALAPTFSGPVITSLSAVSQLLPMPMSHTSNQIVAAAFSTCDNCHPNATMGNFYPGSLHSTLSGLLLPPPSGCNGCHATSRPTDFVGPLATNPARTPASGEMRHDAVAWANGAPTTTALVTQDCAVCHISPSELNVSTWQTGQQKDGGVAMEFHANLTAQPGSCIDCHANSRPVAPLSVPPNSIAFDHQLTSALGDCAGCHAASSGVSFTSWAGGRYHLAGDPNPTTCLPCHSVERPTTTTGWVSTTYTQSPFDYVTNSRGIPHGAGLDCVACHSGPGTGAWGSTQNWVNGRFNHGTGTLSATTCSSCHTSQRADLLPPPNNNPALLPGAFDHSVDGTGDCFGCHQATVTRNVYVNLYSGGALPNGDWRGGVTYPGATFVASLNQSITVQETRLNRSGANNLVTSTTTTNATYYNGMSHTSSVLPIELMAGPTGAPDNTKCWHCHTNDAGVVTQLANGRYHASLNNYRATPGGALAPFAQPTTGCDDCHAQMRPSNIVLRAVNDLFPMDYNAAFTASVNIGGTTTNNANGLDCSRCHLNAAGGTWDAGSYHPRIAAAVPQDCNVCHYPLLADAVKSDLTVGTRYAMKHRSGQITTQACQTCHAAALGQSTVTPSTAARFATGAYHPSVATQPAACVDCHAITDPTASTQSSVLWTFPAGVTTATNRAQWMGHTSASVVGKDCAFCHAADAKQSGAAWSKATVLHKTGVTTATCRECHGLTNGGGAVPGTNNNLPAGLTDSQTVSPVAQVPNSGVAAGTRDQISHADVNVTGKDCNFCHTQAGVGTGAIAGKEWNQGSFHVKFNGANPLLMNGTTGRCSNCHLNVKPGAAYTAYNHTALTGASGSTDCASCHAWPGTGTSAAPNWKGAVGGAPPFLSVGGFLVSQPPASNGTTTVAGISNLPHPAGSNCASCHTGGTGGKNAIGYDHALAPNTQCTACHESGSNLVGTAWNPTAPGAVNLNASCGEGGGSVRDRAGDTRAISLTTLACSDKASTKTCGSRNCVQNHFYPVDCHECHNKPANGIRNTQTGATFVSGWRFPHTRNNMQLTTCCLCHQGTGTNCRP